MSAQLARKHGRDSNNMINESRYNLGLSEKSKTNSQDKCNGSNYFLRKYGSGSLINATSFSNHSSNHTGRQSSRLLLLRQKRKGSGKKFDRNYQKKITNNRRASLRNKEKLVTSLIIPVPEAETSSVISSDSVVYMGTLYNRHPGFGEIELIDLTKSSSNIVVDANLNATELSEYNTHLSLDKNCSVISTHQSNTEGSSHPDSHCTNNPTKKRLVRRRCRSDDVLKFKNSSKVRTIDTVSISSDSTD